MGRGTEPRNRKERRDEERWERRVAVAYRRQRFERRGTGTPAYQEARARRGVAIHNYWAALRAFRSGESDAV